MRRLADASDYKVEILALDVTDLASIKAAATALESQAIDLLLNNAGVGGPRGQKIGNIDYEAWANVLDVNTLGPLRVSEAFAAPVARNERKLIVIYQQHGFDCRQCFWWRLCLSQLEGSSEHGDA